MKAEDSHHLRLATRGSQLARWQAEWVAQRLQEQHVAVELVLITTSGDSDGRPLGSIGGQGLFTKEVQRAVLDGRADLAVHSLKDLPTDPIDGLELAAVPTRESPFDVLVTLAGLTLDELADAARVGTGSQRRRAQLLHARPDLHIREIRGNVDTRLKKLESGEYDAILLAEAGLRRLGLEHWAREVLAPETMTPAVGQGALGIECRSDDAGTRAALQTLNHVPTQSAVLAERALLAAMRAGCSAPLGGWAHWVDGVLRLEAVVLSADGQQRLAAHGAGDDPQQLGRDVADLLTKQGARALIEQVKDHNAAADERGPS